MSEIQPLTNLNNNSYIQNDKTKASPPKDSAISIMGEKIVEEQNTVSNGTVSAAITNVRNRIATVIKTLDDRGSYALKGVASAAGEKVKAIEEKLYSAFDGLNNEIVKISGDKSLTKEEKAERIALIEKKKEALIKEASSKSKILEKIASSTLEMASFFTMLQAADANTNELTNVMKNIINSIDSSPSNLKKIENIEELKKATEENMKNILGKGTEEKLKKSLDDIDKKVEKRKYKLADQFTNYSDRLRMDEELKVFEEEKKLIYDLNNIIKNTEKF